MSETFAARRARLGAALTALDADAALITRLVNVRYLTGLASSNAALLVAPDGTTVLATDSRYAGTARRLCPDVELVVDRRTALTLVERATAEGRARLAYEAHEVTVERYEELAENAELTPLGHAVEELRKVKDDDELESLRTACDITDTALADVLPTLRTGMAEREIAIALERRMVDLGADQPGFETIVASGVNGAIPHHRAGDRVITDGDLVTIDFGARYRGYHADMTRTLMFGRPAEWQRELYDLVARAQREATAAAVPGADIPSVDAVARDMIAAAGHGDDFSHGLGHGIGLEIHEAPFVGYDKTGTLDRRVPVTIEPGVYVAGRGGVRIEDTIVVRDDGPQILTQTTKELLVL